VGLDDPTLLALARRLTDTRLSPASRSALRSAIDSLLTHWGNASGPAGSGTAVERPKPGQAGDGGVSGRGRGGRMRQ
jgi:hypothetical protein